MFKAKLAILWGDFNCDVKSFMTFFIVTTETNIIGMLIGRLPMTERYFHVTLSPMDSIYGRIITLLEHLSQNSCMMMVEKHLMTYITVFDPNYVFFTLLKIVLSSYIWIACFNTRTGLYRPQLTFKSQLNLTFVSVS